jgi:hypothetical protein
MTRADWSTAYDGERIKWRGLQQIARREVYARHYREIRNGAELRASIRAGAYAWPGGYALAFLASDGGAICFDCARRELRSITWSIRHRVSDGWRIVGIAGEHETDEACHCDHCGAVVWSGAESENGAES